VRAGLGSGAVVALAVCCVLVATRTARSERERAERPAVDSAPALAAGPEAAPVRLVLFSDYECDACSHLEREAGAELRRWAAEGRLRLELRHFALRAHRRAPRASAWAICAARAGHGWELHTALLERPSWRGPGPSELALRALADSLGLDGPALSTCAQSEEIAGEVARDQTLGAADGVAAVPAVRLDGRALEPIAPRALLRAVERALR